MYDITMNLITICLFFVLNYLTKNRTSYNFNLITIFENF
jgi:hypothetical protein